MLASAFWTPIIMRFTLPAIFALLLLAPLHQAEAAVTATSKLTSHLKPFFETIQGKRGAFSAVVRIEAPIDGAIQKATLQIHGYDGDSFDFDLQHSEYPLKIQRRAGVSALLLPAHRTAFIARGDAPAQDSLKPATLLKSLASPGSTISGYLPLLTTSDAATVVLVLTTVTPLHYEEKTGVWRHMKGEDDARREQWSIRFPADNKLLFQQDDIRVHIELRDAPRNTPEIALPAGYQKTEIPRDEFERTLVRGARRGMEVLAPSRLLTRPPQEQRQVKHGRLMWVNGHRVALLHGTPEQVGQAHGELLKQEAARCFDSVLHMFGAVQTVRSGKWFAHSLRDAYKKLAPHIPQDHKTETAALASGAGIDKQTALAASVFPELFHCSGFAVSGPATTGGVLYHGRVLDYMTAIGLQDAATTFVVHVDGKIPFVNVGYAGFTGSVTGMNAEKISLGEMGGRGEGKWDGVPMATLMRRALEECDSLEKVKALWKDSPRTCEYYYVFADGETGDACGVAATPEAIEFISRGQAHPRLGDGIEGCVVLSAGDRLKTLRQRVKQHHGKIDASRARSMMSRPVAMASNLHNVLFAPASGDVWIAHATHSSIAAENEYIHLKLPELLATFKPAPVPGSDRND